MMTNSGETYDTMLSLQHVSIKPSSFAPRTDTLVISPSRVNRFRAAHRRKQLRQAGLRGIGCALAAMLPWSAFAELSNDSMVGPGLRSRPAYDGSQSQSLELVPVIRHFGQSWFVRSTQGVLETGVRTELVPGLHIGAQLAYEAGRKVSDSEFLQSHQSGNISSGASVGLHVEWDQVLGPAPVTLLARVRQNVDTERGAQADLRLSIGVFHGGPVSAGVFTQATWADAKSTRALYGIGPQQAAITGLPGFQPGGGLLYSSFGLLWSVDLNPKWVVVGNLERRRLSGDVAHSPLVERSSNGYVSAGIAYRY
jgi:outer membrane scaffolding protein for murein synthesis (MipA/OmpV family)